MQIKVNNEAVDIQHPYSVLDLIRQYKGDVHSGIAVAINNTVVPRIKWQEVLLKENDSALIIQAAQGG